MSHQILLVHQIEVYKSPQTINLSIKRLTRRLNRQKVAKDNILKADRARKRFIGILIFLTFKQNHKFITYEAIN